MILENNNKEISEKCQNITVSNSTNTPKKKLFLIEPTQVPFEPNFTQKENVITFNPNYKINFPNNNQFDFKPKFSIIPNNFAAPPMHNIPPCKFITNKEQTYLDNLKEENHIQENQAEKLKKIKETKFNRKKIKKFKIYHIEFKKLSEKDKFLNKQMHKRKYKPDDIRKKIKARFHKSIKNIINDNLRKAGSKHLFTYLPQVFISSITKEKNRNVLNLSFRELLQKDFVSEAENKKYKNRNVDIAKYKKNINVLKYLDNNPEICQNSGFDIISNMKYADLLDEYFKSEEFERAIYKLREENEDEEYIKEYILKSRNYLNFFMDIPFKIKNNKFRVEGNSKKPMTSRHKRSLKRWTAFRTAIFPFDLRRRTAAKKWTTSIT